MEGVNDSIPGFTISYQEGDDVFIKEDILVEQITVADLKKKMTQIYNTTESMDRFIKYHEGLKEIIMEDLLRQDNERMRAKQDVLNDTQTYDRSYPMPEILEHDQHPDKVHAYAAKNSS